MRMIDADKFIEFWEKASSIAEKIPGELGKVFRDLYAEVIEKIKEQPTVDAVPVVRCKDCMHGTVWVSVQGTEYVDCMLDDFSVRKPDDFCSYGERKDGEK